MIGSGTAPTMGEMGLERLKPPPGGSLPLNGGLWEVPHYETFVAFMNMASRSYWWSFDEALQDSTCNADAMWNDLCIRDPLNARQRPVVMLEWALTPRNEAVAMEKTNAQLVTQIITEIPYLQQLKRCLLDSIFFGKYGVQLLCKWDYECGYKRMVVHHWYPVHGDKIVFKYDGTPGILVNATYRNDQVEYTERGPAMFLTRPEQREGFLIHKFEPEDAGYYRPEFAGAVHGSGMRGRIYWYWWLKQNLQKYLMNFVKKVGNGFLLVGYPASNTAALASAQAAIAAQEGNNVLYIPVNNQTGDTLDKVVTHVQIPMTGADFQWTIITGINEMIRQTLLGESGTTQANGTGLNSDQEQHGITADERVKYDATDLETPMQALTKMLYRWNCPWCPTATYTSLADKRNPKEVMDAANFGLEAGLAIPAAWVKDQLGIPNQVNNEELLAKVQPMQAAAVGNTPAGTPMVGPSGPAGPPQGPPQQ